MSQQRIIGRLGDVNFPQYDGALVFRTPYGVEVEYVDLVEDDTDEDGNPAGMVGRFDVPGPGEWRKEYWAKDLSGIASSVGQSVSDLEKDLNSRSPVRRASVLYNCVKGYTRLCDNEMRLDYDELKRRYARSGPRRSKRR